MTYRPQKIYNRNGEFISNLSNLIIGDDLSFNNNGELGVSSNIIFQKSDIFLSDDSAYYFKPKYSYGVALIQTIELGEDYTDFIVFNTNEQTTICDSLTGSSKRITRYTNEILNGKAGQNNRLNISVHHNGNIYLENRIGSSQLFQYMIFGV